MFYVLLCSWLSCANLDTRSYQVLEFYAGVARIARGARAHGMKACAVDIAYDEGLGRQGSMDATTDSGFAFLNALGQGFPMVMHPNCFDDILIFLII